MSEGIGSSFQVKVLNKWKEGLPSRLFRSFSHKNSQYEESRGGAGGLLSREKSEDASSGGPPLLGVVVWGRNPMGGGKEERLDGRNYLILKCRGSSVLRTRLSILGDLIPTSKSAISRAFSVFYQNWALPTVLTHGFIEGVKKGQFYEESHLKKCLFCE